MSELSERESIRKRFVKQMFGLKLKKSMHVNPMWHTLLSETVKEINKVSLDVQFKLVRHKTCVKITKIKG